MFRVQIDLAMLSKRLSSSREKLMTNGDVFQWLLGRGIAIDHGSWIATLPQLRLLKLREIISSRPLGWVNDPGSDVGDV
jgi:hypothetical protein